MPAHPSPAADPYAAFRVPAYRRYTFGYFISVIGRQAVSLAITYELFQRTHSATALGLVGLVGALPVILMALPAGHLADRYNRKTILLISTAVSVLSSLGLAWLSVAHASVPAWPVLTGASRGMAWLASVFHEKEGVVFEPAVPLMLLLLFITGCARAYGWAARGAFLANIVPRELLASAVTWNSSNFQISSMVGPVLGGVIIARGGLPWAYGLDVLCGLGFLAALSTVRHTQEPPLRHDGSLRELFSGLHFVFRHKVILATITLDLFAVLFGGATALLPMYAEQILHVGATGLGWLRTAPSCGAMLMGIALAYLPPMRRAGVTLLQAVAGFGVASIVFGLSRSFVLSFAMLACAGAFDNISVVVRNTLVQLLTPDSMRGRVSAVNNVFIGSSNEFGDLESGVTAALWGPVASVVVGGIGTIVVVAAVALIWPQIRRIGALRDAHPEESLL
jgi:MFS family permease